jgi:hypothetical protein
MHYTLYIRWGLDEQMCVALTSAIVGSGQLYVSEASKPRKQPLLDNVSELGGFARCGENC